MKIYGSSNVDELAEFIGEDLWVRARVRFDHGVDYCFVRIVDEDSVDNGSGTRTYYCINYLPLRKVSRGGACHCSEAFKNRTLESVLKLDEYAITLAKPLDCVSTDELFITNGEA